MKYLFLALTLFPIQAIHAAGPSDSSALAGEFSLSIASTPEALEYHCPEVIAVSVNEESVVVKGLKGLTHVDTFIDTEGGCSVKNGDGFFTTICTTFNRNSIIQKVTEDFTLVGHVREQKKLEFAKDQQTLIYSNRVLPLPFGFLGLWDDDAFECKYKRR